MADSPFSGGGLLDEFRRRVGDTSYSFVQMEVACNDQASTVALIEVTDNQLLTSIAGGTASSLTLDFVDTNLNTVEKLVNYFNTQSKYSASVLQGGEAGHATADLEITAPRDFLRRKVQLRSRRWADAEILSMLTSALIKLGRDTGTNYSLTTVPSNVKDLLFLLGTLEVYWDQVNNVTKRQGVDLRVDDFRAIHQSLLDEYGRSISAYKSSQPTPISVLTPEQLDDLGSGEIIVGTQMRRNLRTGRMMPSSAAPFPPAEHMVATFIGGAKIQLNWTRSRASGFHHYEVWRGTTADVNNLSETVRPLGSAVVTGTKIHMGYEVERTVWMDGGTSPLPPGTYYYKLYVYNNNGEWAASEVVTATVV